MIANNKATCQENFPSDWRLRMAKGDAELEAHKEFLAFMEFEYVQSLIEECDNN